jgi:hypothetical protein
MPPDYTPAPSTASDEVMALLLQWLTTCSEKHKMCKVRPTDASWLPTRLLDIGRAGDLLRVVNTSDEKVEGRYMTLSHRWGTRTPLAFTESTKATLQSGFSEDLLPATFRDAIKVTRFLGIRFLWIDCLCIPQGSILSLQLEAAVMHLIYSNSWCNIGSAAAQDNHESFLVERNPDHARPIRFLAQMRSEKIPTIVHDLQLWRHGVSEVPLNRRAWVVQERALAPRIVHFGERQVFWECREMRACEAYPLGLPDEMLTAAGHLDRGNLFFADAEASQVESLPEEHQQEYTRITEARTAQYPPLLERIQLSRHAADNPDLPGSYNILANDAYNMVLVEMEQTKTYSSWTRILNLYVQCGLSNGDDKLTALAGLAAQTHKCLVQDNYLAGLWLSRLASDLVWYCGPTQKDDLSPPSSSAQYVAPSWSWASITSAVTISLGPFRSARNFGWDILDAGVELASSVNPYGPVKSGYLRLRGCLFKVATRKQMFKGECVTIDGRRVDNFQIWWDNRLDPPQMDHCYSFSVLTRDREKDTNLEVGGWRDIHLREGLLLTPTGRAPEEYRRIGYFRMTQTADEIEKKNKKYGHGHSDDDNYFAKVRTQGRTKKIWTTDWSPRREFTIV